MRPALQTITATVNNAENHGHEDQRGHRGEEKAADHGTAERRVLAGLDRHRRHAGRLHAADPEPRSELTYVNPFTLLVAVVLSAQATDRGVNRATGPLFAVADTPEAMVALGEDRVRDFIRTIGLFNTKAKNVVALSRILVEGHGGTVPASQETLQALPGVGAKTASVVLNVAFGVPRIAVDTHIFRVSNRIPLAVAATADKVQAGLEAIVPEPYRLHAHHWLILHGRYVCKARRPDCPACVINDLCRYPSKTT